MKRVVLFGAASLLAMGALANSQSATKVQDEQELRRIESETGKFEQQNNVFSMGSLADDWVWLGGKKALSKSEFQENVKRNLVNGPNLYTIEKKKCA